MGQHQRTQVLGHLCGRSQRRSSGPPCLLRLDERADPLQQPEHAAALQGAAIGGKQGWSCVHCQARHPRQVHGCGRVRREGAFRVLEPWSVRHKHRRLQLLRGLQRRGLCYTNRLLLNSWDVTRGPEAEKKQRKGEEVSPQGGDEREIWLSWDDGCDRNASHIISTDMARSKVPRESHQ